MTDNQRYFTLLTDKGKFKIAKAAADKGEVKFSHFAIGDGGGQEVNPTPNQTALVHEVWRAQLDSVEIDPKNPAAVIINAIIPHNVGGFWMREFGLFDVDGDMLAVVKPAPYYKATSAEGQLEDVFYEFQLVIGEQAQVVVLVDPSILWATREYVETRRISAGQMMNKPWLPVISLTQKKPPAKPALGDLYVVPADGTGEWSDKGGQIAEWTGQKWLFSNSRDGHGIGLPDGSIYIKIAGVYTLLTGIFDKRYAKFPEPPANTFYVVGPVGNDKNSGVAPTAKEGFATIQGAIDAVGGRYMTSAQITIQVSPGTYAGFQTSPSTVANWRIVGNPKDPAACKILANSVADKNVRGCVSGGGVVRIEGFSFQTYYENIAASGGSLYAANCILQVPSNAAAVGAYGDSLYLEENITVNGTGPSVFSISDRGLMRLGFNDAVNYKPVEICYNNVAVDRNFSVRAAGNLLIYPSACSFKGSVTGYRYVVESNGVIFTNGAGPNLIPGSAAGVVNTGGQVIY